MKRFPILAITIVGLLLLAGGCDEPKVPSLSRRDKPRVAVTAPLPASLVRELAGEWVELDVAIEASQGVHRPMLSPATSARIETANLIVHSGETDGWMTIGVSDALNADRILRISTFVEEDRPSDGLLWLDPSLVRPMIRELGRRLSALLPEHETELQSRADQIEKRLAALLQEFQPVRDARVACFTLDEQLSPLLRACGIREVRRYETPATQLTPKQILELQNLARRDNVRLMVVAADTLPPAASELSRRLGLPVVRIETLGRDTGTAGGDYFAVMRSNLDGLVRVLPLESKRDQP
jgi:ABC-type Zn uptake system ZnuABC Zn-binding protein ZnuA